MATALPEERVLVPNGEQIRKLRERRGWSIDDAIFHARTLRIPLTRNTLRNAEGGKSGCRLSTIGWIRRLYEVENLDKLIVNIPDPPATERRPRRG